MSIPIPIPCIYPVYGINIIFSPYAIGVKSGDMSKPEFYKNGYLYYLLNGANARISSDGIGTTGAIKELGKNLHDPDYYFKIKSTIDSDGNETGFSSFIVQNTPYFFKEENEENEEKTQIAGVFHVYGKDFTQIPETHRDKSRLENIDHVRGYYGRIIKAVNRMVSGSGKEDKKYILYLARVPGNIFEGGVETVIGMIQAINGCKQATNLTYQIDVSSELYYLVYDYLFFSTSNSLNPLIYEKCSYEPPDSHPEKLAITGPIKKAFERSTAGLPFVHLYKKIDVIKTADDFPKMSIMILSVDLQPPTIGVKCEHILDLNLLNDDCYERRYERRESLITMVLESSNIRVKDGKISICQSLYDEHFKDKKYDMLILITVNGDTTEQIILTKTVLDEKKYTKYTFDTLLFLKYKDTDASSLKDILEKLTYVNGTAICQYQRSDIRWFESMLKRYKEPFNPHIIFMYEVFRKDFNPSDAPSIEDLFGKTDYLRKTGENAIIFYENKIMVYIIIPGKKFSYFVKIDNVTIDFFLDDKMEVEDTFFGIYTVNGVRNDRSCIYELEYTDVFGHVLSSRKSKSEPKSEPKSELETDLKHEDVPPEIEQPPELEQPLEFLRREKDPILTTLDLYYMVTDRDYGKKQPVYNDPRINCDISPSKCGSPVYICVLCKKQIWYYKDEHVPDKNKCDCSIPLYVQNIHLCDEKEKKEKRGDICLNAGFKVSFGDNIKLDAGTLEKVDGVNTFLVNVDDLDDPVRLHDILNTVLEIIMKAILTKEFFQIIFIGEEDKSKNFFLRPVKLTNKHPLIQNNISPAYCTVNGKFSLDRICSKILWYIRYLIMESSPYLRNLRKQKPVPMLFRKKSKVKQTSKKSRSLKKIKLKSKSKKPKKSFSPKSKKSKSKKSKPKKSLKSPKLKKSNKKG